MLVGQRSLPVSGSMIVESRRISSGGISRIVPFSKTMIGCSRRFDAGAAFYYCTTASR